MNKVSASSVQGANLDLAQLQGADLDFAQLQGASLDGAQLQGASLGFAELQGASLLGAQLQGADFKSAQLQGASLEKVFSWRADAREAFWKDTRVINPETGRKYSCRKNDEWSCDWSPELFNELKKLIAEQVPGDDKRRAAMERIERHLDPEKPLDGEDEMANVWTGQAGSPPAKDLYEKRLAEILRETGCAAEGAPYVVRKLLVRFETRQNPFDPFDEQSPQLSALAAAFLDEEHCPGAHGLTDAEKDTLKAIRDRSPPPAPKQRADRLQPQMKRGFAPR